jgi:putative ABC transport system substrate-binding protein
MQRREFITLLGGAVTASLGWPRAVLAQQPPTKVFRIGFLGLPTASSLPQRPEAFRAGLRDLGYREGRDFVIEYRWADGDYDRLPSLLDDLIRLKVDVIVTHGTPGVLAAKRATTTIPIVCAVVGDALRSGIVSSLARPGGNVTGLTRGKAARAPQGGSASGLGCGDPAEFSEPHERPDPIANE